MVGDIEVKRFKEDLERIYYRVLSDAGPYAHNLLSLLRKMRIVLTREVQTAGVTNTTLYVNPDFWNRLDEDEKIFVLLHEALHLGLDHHARFKNKHHYLANICEDIVINDTLTKILETMGINIENANVFKESLSGLEFIRMIKENEKLPMIYNIIKRAFDEYEIPYEQILSMSEEELYHLLEKYLRREGGGRGGFPGLPEKPEEGAHTVEGGIPSDGKVVQEGGYVNPDEADKQIDEAYKEGDYRDVLRDTMTKGAGNIAGIFSRSIRELEKGCIDWKSLLKTLVYMTINKFTFITSWARQHRRLPGKLPGTIKLSTPETIVVIDVSGSIPDVVLSKFIGEVYDILKNVKSKMWLATFSVGLDELIEVKTLADINKLKFVSKLGTVLVPALEEIDKKVGFRNKILIVLSDFLLEDYNEFIEYYKNKLKPNCLKTIFVSTDQDIGLDTTIPMKIPEL